MIEDSYEKSEKASDWITIPFVSRTDLMMMSWAKSWAVSSEGNIRCVACAAEQASSRNDMPFIHEQGCPLKGERIQRPWVILKSLMAALPIAEPQQVSPF